MLLRRFFKHIKLKVVHERYSVIRKFNEVNFESIVAISASVIKKCLSLNSVNFEEGHACFMITCPICSKTGKSMATSKLYINKMTGQFSCPSCMSHGQWNNLESYIISMKKTKKSKDEKPLNVVSHLEEVTKCVKNIQNSTILFKDVVEDKMWETFRLPVVPRSVAEIVKIRLNSTRTHLYLPLENVYSQIVGYKILNIDKNDRNIKTFIKPHNNPSGGILCGKSGTKTKETAILVPNIADFLVLLACKTSSYIVCLPNGVMNLPQHVLPSLERFSKLILWFGNDLSSWDSARNFAKKLGEKRCLFVRPTDKQPLPHLAINQDLKAIIAAARPIWHKSITTFANLREDVLSELQNIDKVHGIKWKRFPTLTRLLKGHRRGELTILTGPTGCGKTTFISEYSLDLATQGVITLWGSFEIRNIRLAKTMLQQLIGLPLDKNLERFDVFADEFEKLPIYYMTFHGQQSVKVVMEAVEHAQYVHDISHVIIDNVQFMMGISEDHKIMDRFWKQDLIIAAFRAFATRKNCHVTLVIHPRKERDDEDLTTSSIFGGAKASQEADNVLIIQDKNLMPGSRKKYIQVAKNRYSGELGIMNLEFDKNALSFAQKKKPKQEKILEKSSSVINTL